MHDQRHIALALLAALAAAPALAGWVTLRDDGLTPGATAIRSGCVAPGQYERPLTPLAAVVTINGLPDSGRCYFALNAGTQDEWVFDFAALAGGRAAPGPVGNLAVTWLPTPPVTSSVRAFNFRATTACATDAQDTSAVLATVYTAARGWGWETAAESRDRNCGLDARLAGVNQLIVGGAPERVFRVDLPQPGRYRVRLAAGDATIANRAFFEIRDGATVLYAQAERQLSAGQFVDASGAVRTIAQWPTQNAPRELVFTTTAARLVLKRPASVASVVAHLSLEGPL